MGEPTPGIVVLFEEGQESADAPHLDAPFAHAIISAALYRSVDGAEPSALTTIYSVTDIEALPPPLKPNEDRRRVYRLIYDSVNEGDDEAKGQERGKMILGMSIEHHSPDEVWKWYFESLPLIRAVPGWKRSRGAQLVEGAPGVPILFAAHNFEKDDALMTEEFEKYVNDPRRAEIISACTKTDRRIGHIVKHISNL